METSVNHSTVREMEALNPVELQAISGGTVFSPDISGMPDRSVQCGTMWLRDHWGRLFPR